MFSLFRRLGLGIAGVAIICMSGAAHAAYPERAIRLIVPFAAGGSTDVIARAVAASMGATLGQSVVVDNRAGGGGVVGTGAAASAAPDGYTLVVAGSTNAVMHDMHAKLAFDPIASFVPVAMVAEIPNVIAVNANVPIQTLGDLIKAAKQDPGKLAYASAGPGTPSNLVCERFKIEAGVDMLHVPYKGNAPAVNDVMAGQVPVMCNNLAGTLPYTQGGRLRLLAVTGNKRSPALPDVPTFAEAGVANLDTGVWMSIVAPAGTPAAVVSRLHDAVAVATASPEVQAQFANFGAVAMPASVDNVDSMIGRERELWSGLIQQLGLGQK